MFKSYIKVAWRNLMKSKTYSFINVFGLSVGLTCCMLITLYILNELSYDKFHKKGDNLYQLGTHFKLQGDENTLPNTPAAMGEMMKQVFPEIKETGRLVGLFSEDKTLLQYKESNGEIKSFYQEKGYLADSTFFRMFTYDFIEGDANTALDHPNMIVLSENVAKKIFGNQPALDKILRVSSSTNGDHDYQVKGVFRPAKSPSHIDGTFFMSILGGSIEDYMKSRGHDLATNNMYYTYLLLQPGSDPKKLESKFPGFMDQYAAKDLKAIGFQKIQFLVKLKDIHLSPQFKTNITPPGSVTYLYILSSIALFTLMIACINFMNLSTARSSKRSAEVGIRKVLGAEKKSLVSQFLGESILMSVIAFLFALGFTALLLPAFNSISGKDLSLSFRHDLPVIAGFFILSFITGLIAGSYPAFYLSSFKPVKVLKGKFSNTFSAVWLRKGLVIFQFIISVILIISSVIITNQMNYLRSADLGFDKDRQVIVPLRSEKAKNIFYSLKAALQQSPQIVNAGGSMYYPGISNPSDNLYYREGQNMQMAKRTRMNYVDEDYLQTLNLKPIAGRLFSKEFPADTGYRLILNEDAIKEIGFASAQKAIGQKVFFDFRGKNYGFEIVGVVKDFHFEDLHSPITPYGFQLPSVKFLNYNYMIVHAKSNDMKQALQSIQTAWQKLNPTEPFEFSFLDESFQKNYDADNRLSAIVKYFTTIAILISCLGLFGLAAFSAEQRVKEIGVRKVLGASVFSIVGLLSKDFLKLVGIAIIIASPIAWYIMNKWLMDFAYKPPISWIVFLITAAIAFFIALFTISFQAIRAATANPVKSLRTE